MFRLLEFIFRQNIKEKAHIYIIGKDKVIPLRPSVAQRVGRGIALLFYDRGTRRR